MSENNDDVKEGLGCILVVIAMILLFIFIGIGDHLVTYLNHWLEAHS